MSKVKKMIPTKAQFNNYQGLYNYFNKKLFGDTLPNRILNFSRKNKRSMGHFSFERWENGSGVKAHEININPMHLKQGDREMCQTLVHEMVHLWQYEFGTPSRAGYHNNEWADKMEEVGLMPSSTGEAGGKRTGQKMADYPIEGGMFLRIFSTMPERLLLPFKSFEETVKSGSKPKAKSKIKYTCPSCDTNAWGKPNLKLICGGCYGNGEVVEMLAVG